MHHKYKRMNGHSAIGFGTIMGTYSSCIGAGKISGSKIIGHIIYVTNGYITCSESTTTGLQFAIVF